MGRRGGLGVELAQLAAPQVGGEDPLGRHPLAVDRRQGANRRGIVSARNSGWRAPRTCGPADRQLSQRNPPTPGSAGSPRRCAPAGCPSPVWPRAAWSWWGVHRDEHHVGLSIKPPQPPAAQERCSTASGLLQQLSQKHEHPPGRAAPAWQLSAGGLPSRRGTASLGLQLFWNFVRSVRNWKSTTLQVPCATAGSGGRASGGRASGGKVAGRGDALPERSEGSGLETPDVVWCELRPRRRGRRGRR